MHQKTATRWSLLSGAASMILWVVATALTGQNEYLPEAEAVATYFSSNAGRISITGYLGTVSAFFLLWFSGSLQHVIWWAGDNRDPLAYIAFGSGLAASLLGMVAFASIRALAERAETATGLGLNAATALIDISGQLTGLALPVAFAGFIGATGFAFLRTGLLPAWFGRVSIILGIALLSPLIYVVMPLGFLWTVIISLWLFARSRHHPAWASKPAMPPPPESPHFTILQGERPACKGRGGLFKRGGCWLKAATRSFR